jgi:hypothetical protein
MRLISHRGNISGKNPESENNPSYIELALSQGYEVEIDVWLINGNFFLGHDGPQYPIDISFLMNDRFWCHAKNLGALEKMLEIDSINCFWHQEDNYTLTSKRIIWAYPGHALTRNSVAVLPESTLYSNWELRECYGVCSDFIEKYKNI